MLYVNNFLVNNPLSYKEILNLNVCTIWYHVIEACNDKNIFFLGGTIKRHALPASNQSRISKKLSL